MPKRPARWRKTPYRRRWRLAQEIALGAVLGGVFLFALVVIFRPIFWYVTGTPAQATVDGCHRPSGHRGPPECHGHWTLPDGTRGFGEIAGSGDDDVGSTVPVRAGRRHAAKAGWGLFGWPAGLVVVPAVLLIGLYLDERRTRRIRARSAGRS